MSFEACAELIRQGDPDRYLSVMAAAPAKRDGLFALYAFNLEIARAPWVTQEEMIAEMRLQWWADTIGEVYEGKVSQHEVVAPLAKVIKRHDLPRVLFDDLITARRFDIYRDGHVDNVTFDNYINATSGNLMQLAALTLGASVEALPVISDFAYGVGVANLFRALPVLYANGRHPIPVNCALDRNAVAGGEVPDNLGTSLRGIADKATAKVRRARQNRRQVPTSVSAAMLAGWQVDTPLTMVMKHPEQALSQPLETSEFRKKATLLWRSTTGRW